MIFTFGDFRVDVDVERTKEFYINYGKTVIDDCGCKSCQNYYKTIMGASEKVLNFFDSLGIDPQKSPEATWWETNENGIAYYTAVFHVVGTVIRSVDLYKPNGGGGLVSVPENLYEVDENFKVGFTSEVVLLEKDFPKPCIQLEIDAHLPWVID
ncbi:MAG: hypothetical protein IJY39_10130 [Clostridia bacterium]|nr:hypothetical protein [Clostridia bacterium]